MSSLEQMRRDALCPERRAAFRESQEAVRMWERVHPRGLTEAIRRIDEIRRRFGAPPPDREPWRGSDYRL